LEIIKDKGDVYTVKNYLDSTRTISKSVTADVEKELIYSLYRGKDVSRWKIENHLNILLPQNPKRLSKAMSEEVMQNLYPLAYAYLSKFKPYLLKRKGYQKYLNNQPFYAVYDIGPYTFNQYKVCWKYLDSDMRSAVLNSDDSNKPLIPDLNLITISVDSEDEAHYLATVLNSSIIRLIVHAFGLCTRISPGILKFLPIAQFDSGNPHHTQLAEISKILHIENGNNHKYEKYLFDIDSILAKLLGLDVSYCKIIQKELSYFI
jgi:hypothetical protein